MLGYLESVGSIYHDLDAAARGGGEFVFGDKHAVALVGSSPYPAAQLVELAQPEAFCVFDNHDGGVGDIDPDFYHGGGNEYVGLMSGEALHLCIFVGRLHLAVDFADLVVGEGSGDFFKACLEVFQVHLFCLFDEGIDDVDLSAEAELTMDEVVDALAMGVEHVDGAYGLAAWGQLVDDADVEVAVEGHGEGARDGCGCHDQHVGGDGVFHPELGALGYSEAVLLVDDDQS